jgi:DNA repair protein RecO (recombination protein O)
MHFTTEGLVLRETEYGDHDKLLTVLTSDRGKMTMRARGVKQKSSRLKSGCQLLAFSEFTVFENRGFCTINEAIPKEMFIPLRNDLERMSLASYFAQVTETLAQEDDPDPELLSLCLNSVYALAYLKKSPTMIKAAFEFRIACQAGYMPQLSGCAACDNDQPDRFCVSAGALLCASCAGAGDLGIRMPVTPAVVSAMRYIASCDLRSLFSFRISTETEKQLSNLTETYLLTQLERGFYALDFYKSLLIGT